MALLTILKSLGGALLSKVVPKLGEKLVDKVNDYIDGDDKLDPKKATGEEVAKKIEGLPPEAQTAIIESELAKEIAEINREKHIDDNTTAIRLAMIEADKRHSWVRPLVVVLMAILVVAGLGAALYSNYYITTEVMKAFNTEGGLTAGSAAEITALKALLPDYASWSIILGFPIWVIRSYFFDRSEDKRARANASIGVVTETKDTFGGSIGKVIAKKIFKV